MCSFRCFFNLFLRFLCLCWYLFPLVHVLAWQVPTEMTRKKCARQYIALCLLSNTFSCNMIVVICTHFCSQGRTCLTLTKHCLLRRLVLESRHFFSNCNCALFFRPVAYCDALSSGCCVLRSFLNVQLFFCTMYFWEPPLSVLARGFLRALFRSFS